MDPLWLVLPIVICLIIALVALTEVGKRNSVKSGWEIFADRHGFTSQQRAGLVYTELKGTYCGRELSLRCEERYDKNWFVSRYRTPFTYIRIAIQNPQRISMTCENKGSIYALDQLAQQVGINAPLRTGDAIFDNMFRITGEPEEAITGLMQDRYIQGVLRGLQPADNGTIALRLEQTALVYERAELLTRPEQLQRLLEIGCELADKVEARLVQSQEIT